MPTDEKAPAGLWAFCYAVRFICVHVMNCLCRRHKGAGLGQEFLSNWPGAWGASWIIAFPSLLLILPIVRRIVSAIVEQPVG